MLYYRYVVLKVGIDAMDIEPLKFLVIGISYIFGLLMLLTVFQMWPGSTMKQPLGGLANSVVDIPLAFSATMWFWPSVTGILA